MNDEPRASNGHPIYADFATNFVGEPVVRRWIGRCKRCKTTHRVEGVLGMATRMAGTRYARRDQVIKAIDDQIFMIADLGTNPSAVQVRCADHWVRLERVYDAAKPNTKRHECSAKCRNSTGPACECKCKGLNHGCG